MSRLFMEVSIKLPCAVSQKLDISLVTALKLSQVSLYLREADLDSVSSEPPL